jgi:hypothetical protein
MNYYFIIIFFIFNIFLFQPFVYSQTIQSTPESMGKTIIVTSETVDFKKTGLRVFKPEKCFDGYVLFNYIKQSYECTDQLNLCPIYLINTMGNIAYEWMPKITPQFARLNKDGHLFYISELEPKCTQDSGFRELDTESNELWFYPGLFHHDFHILKNAFMVTADERVYLPRDNSSIQKFVTFPRIEIISRDKKILWDWNGKKHIKEFERILGGKINFFKYNKPEVGDWFHNNACEILNSNLLEKKDKRFKKGNIIFCSFHLDLIGIIEYPSGKIVWSWGPGILDGPHSPTMLDNGNLLIFDNGTKRNWSRIIEVNPLTKKIVWEYHASPKEFFFSHEMSSALRLPNGNIFICSGQGRLFEITPQGEVVWDFIPTFNKTIGLNGILRAEKYSKEYVESMLRITK